MERFRKYESQPLVGVSSSTMDPAYYLPVLLSQALSLCKVVVRMMMIPRGRQYQLLLLLLLLLLLPPDGALELLCRIFLC